MYPQPLFELFGQGVNLYGIFIGLCIIACFIVYWIYTAKAKMDKDLQDVIFFIAIISIVIGFLFAKIFQAVYTWIATGVFDFKSAGITVMGGLVGGAGTFLLAYFLFGNYYFTGKRKGLHIREFGKIMRVAPCCIAIAHSIGRISCLMSGCCHGAYLGQDPVPGGIWMLGTVDNVSKWGYYVPAQLYEAIFLLVLFVVLSVLFFKKSNILLHVYLIAYAVWRFIIEFFRTDIARGELIPGLTPSQWMSILFLLIGIGLLVWYKMAKIPFKLNDIGDNFVFFEKDKVLLETVSEEVAPVEEENAVKEDAKPLEETSGKAENGAEEDKKEPKVAKKTKKNSSKEKKE